MTRKQAAALAADKLLGLRLGRIERKILLGAAPAGGEFRRFQGGRDGKAALEAMRRALRKLHRAGLLDPPTRHRKRLVRLSVLGEAVVNTHRYEMENSGRIRWNRRGLFVEIIRAQVRAFNRSMLLTGRDLLAAEREQTPPRFQAFLESLPFSPHSGRKLRHEPVRARVEIGRKKDKVTIQIRDFVSPAIIERLQQQAEIVSPRIDDWRAMVDCVLIDPAYDGSVFNIVLADNPEKKTDLVAGELRTTRI